GLAELITLHSRGIVCERLIVAAGTAIEPDRYAEVTPLIS
ncbi:hypothetical protein pipiens_000853, partial [Culex pipiens pipiens]